ncbi:tRNA modification GTPase MnmE [Nymphon striatum]|nr:tRNA modification GTPase MnmE [Nymphon striatum]
MMTRSLLFLVVIFPVVLQLFRISGSVCTQIAETMIGGVPQSRNVSLQTIIDPQTFEELDRGLVLWFPGPASFTGEDCLEFHLHGGRAVVAAVVTALCRFDDVRLAEAGEFSRRAFENGKLDLTEIEGIADLVSSETEAQRKQALAQSRGDSREIYEEWRQRLIHMRALIEAELDFSEEEDIPDEISKEGFARVLSIKKEIEEHLADNRAGEIIRDGFKIALMGKPNAGKSSLLNALAKRDVAIVTQEAGTTRDVLDIHLDIGGYAVIVSDTAGLRESDDVVEVEGIRRANLSGSNADLVVWLSDVDDKEPFPTLGFDDVLYIKSKDDKNMLGRNHSISVNTNNGLNGLMGQIENRLKSSVGNSGTSLISRMRYREALVDCVEHLKFVLEV